MNAWLKLEDVAEYESVSVRALRKRVSDGFYKKDDLKSVESKGGPGGKVTLLSFNALSAAAQNRYLSTLSPDEMQQDHSFLDRMNDNQRAEYDRRLRVVDEVNAARHKRRIATIEAVAAREGVTKMTVYRWIKQHREKGLAGLVPHMRNDAGSSRIDEELQELAISLYYYRSAPSRMQVWRAMKEHCKEQGVEEPSYTALARLLDRWGSANPADAYARRHGMRAARLKFGVFIPRDFSLLAPNDLWMGDHSPLDLLVINPANGSPARPWITAWLDVATRVIMGWHVSFQPSSRTIALALKRGIAGDTFRGIPKQVYIDNGKDYRATHLSGKTNRLFRVEFDPETHSVFSALGVGVTYALPYNARAKAQIERWFGTLERQFVNLHPGYTGCSVANRPDKLEAEVKKGDLLTFAQAVELVEKAIHAYHRRAHSSLNGKAPLELFMEKWVREDLVDVRGLELLLLHRAERRVNRDGIHLHGFRYFLSTEQFIGCVGKTATVRYDPQDPSRVNVVVGDEHFGWIPEVRAVAPGDGAALRLGMQLQRNQEKRWKKAIAQQEKDRQRLDGLLLQGAFAADVEIDEAAPSQKRVKLTGLEGAARKGEEAEAEREEGERPRKLFRFAQGQL